MDHFNDFDKNSLASSEVAQKELVLSFFSSREVETYSLYQSLALDLYRSITFFRTYGKVEKFITAHQDFADYKEDIGELWAEFEHMSEEELAEVSLRILTDL
jgi:hypothetical protein